jgi:hypothetical protein
MTPEEIAQDFYYAGHLDMISPLAIRPRPLKNDPNLKST